MTHFYKDIAANFLKLVTSGKIEEAYEKYVASDFRHHNPYFKGDAESLKVGMEENEKKFPNKSLEIKHVFEDGDLVVVHSRVQLAPTESNMVVVHIFRIEGDKIVELWDVAQKAPKENINENGMF